MARDKVQTSNVSAFVNKQLFQNGKPRDEGAATEETLEPREFKGQPSEIFAEFALTMNLGNYESAKVTVGLRVPCSAEDKDADYETIRNWVTERVRKEALLVRGKLKHKSSIPSELFAPDVFTLSAPKDEAIDAGGVATVPNSKPVIHEESVDEEEDLTPQKHIDLF